MTVSLLKKNHGLTFIEVLIAMLMGLLVLGAVLNIFVSQNRTNAVQQEVAYAQQNVRAAMDLMAREIRSAGYDPTLSALIPIPAATATSIQIRADFVNGGDGATADAGEDVTYSEVTDASGTCLVRNDTFATTTLSMTWFQAAFSLLIISPAVARLLPLPPSRTGMTSVWWVFSLRCTRKMKSRAIRADMTSSRETLVLAGPEAWPPGFGFATWGLRT